MFTSHSIRILNFCAIIVSANCVTKIWSPEKSDLWEHSGSNKCGTTRTVLSKQLDGVFYMGQQQEKSINEFVLPLDGAIVVPDAFQLQLANAEKCTEDNYMVMKQLLPQSWFDYKNWRDDDPTNNFNNGNIAKPHIDRIPCECDIVLIPTTSGVSIDLEMVDEIVVLKILINGRMADFNLFLETEVGQRMFTNTEAVRNAPGVCAPPKHRACHSYKHFHEYLALVCEHAAPKCSIPHCLNPIQPIGHCCPICGATMDIRIRDQPNEFEFDELNRMIQSKLRRFRNGRYLNTLQYYIGFVPSKKADDKLVQLVVGEVDEYTGISGEFMLYISKEVRLQGNYDVPILTHMAGIPYVPSTGSSWTVVFGTFLLVAAFYGVVYVYYVKQPQMPDWMPISRFQPFRNSVVFARFGNRQSDENDGNDDITVEFNETTNIADHGILGFNNPLFKSDNNQQLDEHRNGDANDEPDLFNLNQEINKDEDDDDIESIKLVDVDLDSDR